MPHPIDFWFSVGSTYSYLTVARIEAASAGVEVRWRPFSVRAIMQRMGNVPFANKPAKAAYMWRDIARRAAARDLPARLPAPYPLQQFNLANQIAILGLQEGWGRDYLRASYRLWMAEHLPPGEPANLAQALDYVGQDPDRVRRAAMADEVSAALLHATEEAGRLGIFGSPSFVVDGELFWGDDRLEDALDWAHAGRLARAR